MDNNLNTTTPKNDNKDNKKRKLLIFFIILLVLVLVIVSAVAIPRFIGKNAMHDYDDMNISPSVDTENVDSVDNNGKTITYKGETYNFNEDVTTLVLMGIDETDYEYEGTKRAIDGTSADAVYIAVIDTEKESVTLLNVPRNSMVDVDVYDKDGNFVETKNEQLFLSHSYLDSKEKSAENTLKSLETLFNGMNFDTYYAINHDAVEEVNDSIGGVTLTPQVEFYSVNEQKYIKAGEKFTLKGHDAVMYIRSREWDNSDLYVDNNRVSRQVQYMQEFSKQLFPSIKEDPSVVEDMYNAVKENTTTNIDVSKFTYLVTTAIAGLDSYKDIKYDVVKGELTEGDIYNEYNVDKDALMEQMIKLFYEKAE